MAKSHQHGTALNLEFQLDALADDIEQYADNLRANVTDALEQIGFAWEAGAKQRAPVDNGTLRNRITHEVDSGADTLTLYVGVPAGLDYAAFVEFGTKWIAGGRVKALGTGPDVTDAQAIKLWPAKNEGSGKKKDGFLSSKTGQFHSAGAKRAHDMAVQIVLGGGASEQMPWLRPAYNAIADQAVDLIAYAAGYDAD